MQKGARRTERPCGWVGLGECRLLLDDVRDGQREHLVVDGEPVHQRGVGRLESCHVMLEIADTLTQSAHLGHDPHVRPNAYMTEQRFCHGWHASTVRTGPAA